MTQSVEATAGSADTRPSDAALVGAALAGDGGALEALFRRHLRASYGLAYRLIGRRDELEDVVQESFAQALTSLGALEDHALFGTWLGRIVIHTAHRVLRRDRLLSIIGFRTRLAPDVAGLLAPSAPPEVRIELDRLYRALERLPERARTVFIMRRIEGRKLEEIAELMGTSLASVKRWIAKAQAAVGDEGGWP